MAAPGLSPATSIKYAGLPWEMGLTEAHQVLAMNNLRDRVTLRTDGGLRTGRDIVMAAMMGAEEYGIGTAALIAMGCIMVRQCQSNTCPVGVCTQDERLREKFTGTADKVVNLITFYAQEVREVLASIGARSLDEVIGRADLLTQVSRGAAHLDDLDLNPLLITVDGADRIVYDRYKPRNAVPDTLDAEIVKDAARFLEDGEKMQLSYAVQNTDRTIGTRVSSHIVQAVRDAQSAAARPPDREADRLAGPVAGRLRRAGAEARGVGRRQRLCRQGPVGRHHRGAPADGLARWWRRRTRHHRQHRALRRDRRLSLRRGPRRRALCRAQLRRQGGGRGRAAPTGANT
jgi:hypothetical protein